MPAYEALPIRDTNSMHRDGRSYAVATQHLHSRNAFARFQRKQKTDRMNLSVYSGIGIRTPTYRVRVCCATFTQYRYLYLVREAIFLGVTLLFGLSLWLMSSRRVILYHIRFRLSTPFRKKVEKSFLKNFCSPSCKSRKNMVYYIL